MKYRESVTVITVDDIDQPVGTKPDLTTGPMIIDGHRGVFIEVVYARAVLAALEVFTGADLDKRENMRQAIHEFMKILRTVNAHPGPS